MIYFVQRGEGGPIKIGTTTALSRRLVQLGIKGNVPLILLAVMDGDRDEEQAIHERFPHLRLEPSSSCEWFHPGADLTAFIETGRPWDGSDDVPRETIVHMKGSREYNAWLSAAHKKTHIPKVQIFRLAVADWAAKNGLPPPPEI